MTKALTALVVLALTVAPVAVVLAVAARSGGARSLGRAAAVLGLGGAAFALARPLEELALRLLGQDAEANVTVGLAFQLLVSAPLRQGLAVGIVAPWLAPRVSRREVLGLGVTVAVGMSVAQAVTTFFEAPPWSVASARLALALPAHVFFALVWAHVIGRDPERRVRGRQFNAAWLGSTLFYGLYEHIVFGRGTTALVATAPLLLGMLLALLFTAPEAIVESTGSRAMRSRLLSVAPPSIRAMAEALQRSQRPLMPHWVAVGALVTVGVLTTALASAVVLGRKLGLDFAAIDRTDAASDAAAPLLLLALATLASFPFAGYLVARASAADSVLEAAVAAALAIVGVVVLLGVAAPVTVVFGIAFAPIAFGLACIGAWAGIVH
jgi:hypothetical protein